MPKWEYKVIPLVTQMKAIGYRKQEEVLFELGSEGWELVSAVLLKVEEGMDIIAYLKRERR